MPREIRNHSTYNWCMLCTDWCMLCINWCMLCTDWCMLCINWCMLCINSWLLHPLPQLGNWYCPSNVDYQKDNQHYIINMNYILYYGIHVINYTTTVHNNWSNCQQQTRYRYRYTSHNKAAYLINAAIPNRENLYSTITKKQQEYTDLKKELTKVRKWMRPVQYH